MDNTVLKAIHDMPGPHGRLQKLLREMVCQIYISFGSLTSVLTYSSLFVTATSHVFLFILLGLFINFCHILLFLFNIFITSQIHFEFVEQGGSLRAPHWYDREKSLRNHFRYSFHKSLSANFHERMKMYFTIWSSCKHYT